MVLNLPASQVVPRFFSTGRLTRMLHFGNMPTYTTHPQPSIRRRSRFAFLMGGFDGVRGEQAQIRMHRAGLLLVVLAVFLVSPPARADDTAPFLSYCQTMETALNQRRLDLYRTLLAEDFRDHAGNTAESHVEVIRKAMEAPGVSIRFRSLAATRPSTTTADLAWDYDLVQSLGGDTLVNHGRITVRVVEEPGESGTRPWRAERMEVRIIELASPTFGVRRRTARE